MFSLSVCRCAQFLGVIVVITAIYGLKFLKS